MIVRHAPHSMVAARLLVVFPAGLICHKMAGIGANDGLCTDRKADRDPVIVHAGRVYHPACPADMMT
ncbi:hypothetical protein [Gluconacetobacter sp.]|uniref:hypothetical protein n=1 Tax=Gluconacetobacter sp. TaxID=1935994 RepID=UPI0039EBBCD1